MQRIGIMQGRLVAPEGGGFQCFPRQEWIAEFALAAAAGLETIEWIYDVWGQDANPISSDGEIGSIATLAQQHGIAVTSLCADYFMERPLIRIDLEEKRKRIGHLIWLISRCRHLSVTRIVLPFVDNSSIHSKSEMSEVIAVLRDVLPWASDCHVELHLETSLKPSEFAVLLDQLPVPEARANYDIGNSASLGYDFREELSAYGNRIGSVHIKDRVLGGGTVPLGQGSADIPGVLTALRELGYSGDFILQAARGEAGKEVELAQHNRRIVQSILEMSAQEIHGSKR
jgi:L-ribulose-5-phosphate 3-epimerase